MADSNKMSHPVAQAVVSGTHKNSYEAVNAMQGKPDSRQFEETPTPAVLPQLTPRPGQKTPYRITHKGPGRE